MSLLIRVSPNSPSHIVFVGFPCRVFSADTPGETKAELIQQMGRLGHKHVGAKPWSVLLSKKILCLVMSC